MALISAFFWGVEVGEAFGKGHLDTLGGEVDGAKIAFGEGDQDFAGCAVDNQQGNGAGGAVDIFDFADEDGAGAGYVEEGAAEKVGDVNLVAGEWGSLGQWNGYDEAIEGFGGGDGIYSGKVKDDAAFMRPMGHEFNFARGYGGRKCLRG